MGFLFLLFLSFEILSSTTRKSNPESLIKFRKTNNDKERNQRSGVTENCGGGGEEMLKETPFLLVQAEMILAKVPTTCARLPSHHHQKQRKQTFAPPPLRY